MIFYPLRCAAVRDLPEPIASIKVDGGDPGPWWFDDRQPLDIWCNAPGADHLDVRLARLRLLHAIHCGVRTRGRPDVQESRLGIKRAAFPVDSPRTGECEGTFRSLRGIDNGWRRVHRTDSITLDRIQGQLLDLRCEVDEVALAQPLSVHRRRLRWE